MNFPENLKYAKSHEWLEDLGGIVKVGISDYAQSSLGDIVFVNLPEVGDDVIMDERFADVESVKAVSDIYSPVTGKVVAVNEDLIDAPEKINENAYAAWLIEVGDVDVMCDLLDAAEYKVLCEAEE